MIRLRVDLQSENIFFIKNERQKITIANIIYKLRNKFIYNM